MSLIPGSIPVTGFLGPTDSNDTYAVTDAIYGIDGYRSVSAITARNAITTERRREGMLVYTQDDKNVWQLLPAPWSGINADWKLFISSAATASLTATTSFLSLSGGTVSGDTQFTTNLSAGSLYINSTNIGDLFIPLSGNGANLVTGDITIDDAVNLSWNAGSDTLQYNPGSTNIELTTSNGFDVVSGAILSAGTNLYDIFSTNTGTTIADNGLSLSGQAVVLGGTLVTATTIDTDINDFNLYNSNNGWELIKRTNTSGSNYTIIGGLGGNSYLNNNQPTSLMMFAGGNNINSTFGPAGGIVLIGSVHTISNSSTDVWLFGDYGNADQSSVINSFGRSNNFYTASTVVNAGNNNGVTQSSTITLFGNNLNIDNSGSLIAIGQNSTISSDSNKVYLANNNNFAVLNNSGDFGIGTVNALDRLHVSGGTIRINTLNGTEGAGKLAVSDLNGSISFSSTTELGLGGGGDFLPLSGGTMYGNISMSGGNVVKSFSGGGQLDLRYGADSKVLLDTNSGGYDSQQLYMEAGYVELSDYSAGGSVNFYADKIVTLSGIIPTPTDNTYVLLADGHSTGTTYIGAGPFYDVIKINGQQGIANAATISDKPGTFISTNGSYFNTGVANSVIAGGSGITASNNNTLYAQRLALTEPSFAPLNFPVFTSTPGTLSNGDVWIISGATSAFLNVRVGGVTKTVELT